MGCLTNGCVSSGLSDSSHEKVISISGRRYYMIIEAKLRSPVRTSLGTRIHLFIYLYIHSFNKHRRHAELGAGPPMIS